MIDTVKIKNLLYKASSELDEVQTAQSLQLWDELFFMENKLFQTAEKTLLEIRHTLSVEKEKHEQISLDCVHKATFEVTGEVLTITMPRLIARKHSQRISVKNYYNTMFAGDFLNFSNTSSYHVKGSYVIWFQHSYMENTQQPVLDHDNMETKTLTDMVSRIIGEDDSAFDCSTFVSSIHDIEDKTTIRVIPKKLFSTYLDSYF